MHKTTKRTDLTYYRTFVEVLDSHLWPFQGLFPNPEESRRHSAVLDVLRRIPADWYKRLETTVNSFSWFIPAEWMRASVWPFPVTEHIRETPVETVTAKINGVDQDVKIGGKQELHYAQVLYLSPLLDRAAWDIIIACVAHELAHIALGHDLMPGNTYDSQEEAAWALVKEWGFVREERKHRMLRLRQERAETS